MSIPDAHTRNRISLEPTRALSSSKRALVLSNTLYVLCLYATKGWFLGNGVGVFWVLMRLLACAGLAALVWEAWKGLLGKKMVGSGVEVNLSFYSWICVVFISMIAVVAGHCVAAAVYKTCKPVRCAVQTLLPQSHPLHTLGAARPPVAALVLVVVGADAPCVRRPFSAQPEVRGSGLRCSPGPCYLDFLLAENLCVSLAVAGGVRHPSCHSARRDGVCAASVPAQDALSQRVFASRSFPTVALPPFDRLFSPLLGPTYAARNCKPVPSTPTLQLRLSFPPRRLLRCRHTY